MKMYDKYSNIDDRWISDFPEHWELRPLRSVFWERKEKNNPVKTDEVLSLSAKHGVQLYSEKKHEGGNRAKEDKSKYNLAYPGDLIVNCMNVISGSVGVSKWFGAISPVYYALVIRNESFNLQYYNYIFSLEPFQRSLLPLGRGILMHESSTGKLNTIRLRISMNDLNSVTMLVPPREEQDQIVRYLDWKVSEINHLIHGYQKQIALLKERRVAVINQAVTKGIQPDVEMRYAGYDHIGMIPSEWSVCRIKDFCILQNGISKGGDFFGSGYPFVNYGDVYKNDVLPYKPEGLIQSTQDEKNRYSVQRGDIFFTRTSETLDEVGFSSVCMETIDNACFSGFLIRVRPFRNVMDIDFAKYYFRAYFHRAYFTKEMNLVTRASLGQTLLKSLPVLLPSLKEQKEIANYLDIIIGQIDMALYGIEKQIVLLREYRTRLISDVVTGQIDVRDVVIPDYQMETDNLEEDADTEDMESEVNSDE